MPTIPGPHGPLSYRRDRWGYPQIQVNDWREGAYARGYFHATDRLVQVNLSLMLGQGRMMEMLGDTPVSRMLDRAVRALDFVSDLDAQVRRLDGPTRELLNSYCQGFNRAVEQRSHPLPLRGLGLAPLEYRPEHVLLMYRFISYFGLTSMHHLAEGVIAELVDEGASDGLLELLLGSFGKELDREALAAMQFPESYAFLQPPPQPLGGSNAFAVDARRSTTGGALLMGEFHMEVGRFPPIVYAVHCQFRDGDCYSGVGIPGLAWLSAGRNRHVGWTYTFGHADNIDILVERCEAGKYLAQDQWIPMKRRVEVVFIQGKEPERWVFYDTDYGAVLGDAMEPGDYPCVRWSGLRKHTATDINAVRAAMDAKDVERFVETHREIRVLSLATVVADSKGELAYIQTGQVDQRPEGWQGAVPRKAWDLPPEARDPAPLPESARPLRLHPEEGFLVSANERQEGPQGELWCPFPEPAYRYLRIRELLQAKEAVELRDLVQISYDECDGCARRLVPVWAPFLPPSPEARGLTRWATTPKRRYDREDRRFMGIFYALHHELLFRLLQPELGAAKTRHFLEQLNLLMFFQSHTDAALALEKPHLLDEDGLKALLQEAWPAALHRAYDDDWSVPPRAPFKNVLTQGKLPTWAGFSSKSMELPGGPSAPFQSRVVSLQGEAMVGGPVFHLVMDMSQQGSWYNIAGGASESRFGPGYGKGLEAWREGRFEPLGETTGPKPGL